MENNTQQIKTPKITVVTPYFYPKIGGVENYAHMLAKYLHINNKCKVSVITSSTRKEGAKKESIDGIDIYRLPYLFKVSNTPINPFWYWQIRKILKKEQPDIIHIHAPVSYMPDIATMAAKKTSVVLTYHSGSMRKNKWFIDIFISLYETIFLKRLFNKAKAIITISQEFAKNRFPEFKDKMHFIPTGVELQRFIATPLPINRDTITFIGRIEHSSSWKGVDQLLKAMVLILKEKPDAKLELIGGGDAISYYEHIAETLGISQSVFFTGPLTGEELVDGYKRSTAVILPSTSDAEAFSVTLVEAMASGRPIVGTNIGGTPQVITDRINGLLVEPSNPQKLADGILEILQNPTLADELGSNGAIKAQDFSWDIQTDKYFNLFNNILKK